MCDFTYNWQLNKHDQWYLTKRLPNGDVIDTGYRILPFQNYFELIGVLVSTDNVDTVYEALRAWKRVSTCKQVLIRWNMIAVRSFEDALILSAWTWHKDYARNINCYLSEYSLVNLTTMKVQVTYLFAGNELAVGMNKVRQTAWLPLASPRARVLGDNVFSGKRARDTRALTAQ
jgi:hypothetical protein